MALGPTQQRHCIVTAILFCLLGLSELNAQQHDPSEIGIPFIRNFTPKEYNFHPQNWVIVQDHRGIMFFANTAGILEYDGSNWKQHSFFKNLTVTALAADDQGRIYIGGRGDFGYLEPDPLGNLRFVSLVPHLDEQHKNFPVVWEIAVNDAGVFFRTSKFIFCWNDTEVQTWETETSFGYMAQVRETLYILEKNVGLQTLQNDVMTLLPGGERFANTTMYVILPFDTPNRILLGTRTEGLFVYDGQDLTPLPTEADALLRNGRLYHGAKLEGSEPLWALGTTRGGLVVVDVQGRIRQFVNKKLGLLDDKVHFVFQDRQGALWTSLNNGISRLEFPSPFALFDQRHGLAGTPHAIARHEGQIYIATNRGLFYLGPGQQSGSLPGENGSSERYVPQFMQVPGITSQVWAIRSVGDVLFAGAAQGIYSVRRNRASLVTAVDVATYSLFHTKDDPETLFAGIRNGLLILTRKSGNWRSLGKIEGISEEIQTIAGERPGVIWLGTAFQGVLRVEIDPASLLTSTVQRYGINERLPEGMTYTYQIDGDIRIGTYQGLYQFDQAQERFKPDSSLGVFLADTLLTINRIAQDASGRIWAMTGPEKSQMQIGVPAGDGIIRWSKTPFQRLVDVNYLMDILVENEDRVWLVGRDEKIYRFNPNFSKDYEQTFLSSVRRVSLILGDSLLWGGAFLPGGEKALLVDKLPYQNNSIRFEYAAASYDESSANRYQIKLDGFDEDWLAWTPEIKKDYTGLPAGDYTFRVRAKNIYEARSNEGLFSFSIMPPWYQSWWAYGLYGILAAAAILLIVQARVSHLQRKTRELEAVVEERTHVIRDQADKLQELDRMKSRFFANISHEFRTPLTLILGPLKEMHDRTEHQGTKDELNMMQRNANRVLHLINQLLDLSRFESGKMKLQAKSGDLIQHVKGIVMSFASLAERKNINMTLTTSDDLLPSGEHPIYFDAEKIEQIFANLLSNAFKFTPDGGRISVNMAADHRDQTDWIEITVNDTGSGIPARQLPYIFDRFYQADGTSTREQEGTGIGLALTKELIELHHGTISVSSEENKGTRFTIKLPVGKKHLLEDEIMQDHETIAVETSAQTVQESAGDDGFDASTGDFVPAPALVDESEEDAPIILVVDDHEDVRKYISSHLASEFRIIEAEDGESGRDTAIELVPDLVLSDVMMPKMDGFQLCEALKTNEKTSHIPIVLLTAKAGDQDKLVGLEIGADDYLTKPFDSQELRVRVHNLIEGRRKLQEMFRKERLLKPGKISVTSIEEAFIKKMMAIVEENLGEEEFGVEKLSNALFMSRRQLHRKIKAIAGQTPTDFIRSVRLERANQLLEQRAGTVSEIAFQTGFSSLPYFSKAFKDQFGLLPSEVTSD